MNAPVRKPVVTAEATQELQAADVIEVLGAKAPAKLGAARGPLGSQSSIAPVGLDLAVGADDGDDEEVPRGMTGRVLLPTPRKRFKGLVIGVVSGCALILVAAGIARVVHASDEPAASTAHASAAAAGTATTQAASPAAAPAPTGARAPAPVAAAVPDGMSTGTVQLNKPAKPGHVWLDGKKLTSSSALVSCGTHQVKVGFKRAHSIDVPCGGEIAVSR